jgi:glycosyltransferase involved in cell wall biosynthesis
VSRPVTLTVLHLAANRWWTGSAEPVIRLVSGLRARGHRVHLGLIPGDRFEEKARAAGIEPVPGLALASHVGPAALLGDFRRVWTLVRREGVDIVHTHHSHDHWLGALVRGRAALVRTFHNRRSVALGWPARQLYRRTQALVAVSREIEDRCRQAGIPPGALFRHGGVVDVARFVGPGGGEGVRRTLGVGPAPVIGCVARLAAGRGHELLIEAFRQVRADQPGARLVLVGKGEARPALEGLVSRLGLDGQVLFAGYRDADLPAWLDAMDVFALLGAGSDESCRAVLEAMAAGRPVVARNVGALAETVVDGRTGLLVGDDRPESVARALTRLLADPDRARRMGAAGRARALEDFSEGRHAEHALTIYRAALARRAR